MRASQRCAGKAHRRARSSSSSARRSSARSCCARNAATSRSRSAAAAAAASAAAWRQHTSQRPLFGEPRPSTQGRQILGSQAPALPVLLRFCSRFILDKKHNRQLNVRFWLACHPAHLQPPSISTCSNGVVKRAWSRASRSACHAAMRRCSAAAAARSAAFRPSCSALLATTYVSQEDQSCFRHTLAHTTSGCRLATLQCFASTPLCKMQPTTQSCCICRCRGFPS